MPAKPHPAALFRHLARWHAGAARLRALVPSDCPVCAGRARGGGLCDPCEAALCGAARASGGSGLPWRCPRCALPLPEHDACCPDCADRVPAFDRTIIAFDYTPPADLLVLQLKNGLRYGRAGLLGNLLAESVLEHAQPLDLETVLVPVPASAASLRRRGFNPAAEIAQALGRDLGLPVRHGLLERTREQAKQSGLGRQDRRASAHGLYLCRRPLAGMAVGLVDDVMTTGSTLHEAAAALRAAGARHVSALAVARTPGQARTPSGRPMQAECRG
ncbi:DNA utilization protein GntX [Pigmentiphaga humi]|uniref:DNA utilization protein GntX n=1 Tax=Pigmentiphaga humi TaxID=2478468 RepID=A0A3P4B2N5_9BURK|nr:phosphoribosyltransferase family protein [Pigmentiphaga humi]VCU70544.1 DNA utilization protein GntX [Pigmentiphaga humi]